MRFRRWAVARAIVTCSVVVLVSCRANESASGRGLLPPPPPGPEVVAAPPPAAPFDQAVGARAVARTVFDGPGPSGTGVEIRDVVVGPHAGADLPPLQGPAVADVHAGRGQAVAGDRVLALSADGPVTLPGSTAIKVANPGDLPLSMRLYVLWSR
jgi:hypothetical protein